MSVPRLLLIGGGHAHVLVLRKLARQRTNIEVTLVSDVEFAPYSGMLPGFLAGHYEFSDLHFHLPSLCANAGATFHQAAAVRLDSKSRCLLLADDSNLTYDVASFDIGSQPSLDGDIDCDFVTPLKPVSTLIARWQVLLENLRQGKLGGRLAVVGGGVAGYEVAMALIFRAKSVGLTVEVSLIEAATTIVPTATSALRRALLRHACRFGLQVHCGQKVTALRDGLLTLEGGMTLPCDHALWATRADASPLFASSGLPTDRAGFLTVDENLAVASAPNLFGAGDCIAFPVPLPKAGVYAVRQAPILFHNLLAACRGDATRKSFVPQRSVLALVTAGERFAYGEKRLYLGGSSLHWQIKDHIDRRFMAGG